MPGNSLRYNFRDEFTELVRSANLGVASCLFAFVLIAVSLLMIVSSGSAFLPWQAKYSLEDYVKKTNRNRFISMTFMPHFS